MLKPGYSISMGSVSVSSDRPGPLATVEVEREKNAGADWAVVQLGAVPAPTPSEGDPATIQLGWDGANTLVFTGSVHSVAAGALGTEVHCSGNAMKLMQKRSNRTFVNQAAGQVVTALASDAGAAAGQVRQGFSMPSYLVDSSRHGWDHCLALAARCGYDLYTKELGTIVFAPFSAFVADHTLEYGVDIVSARVERAKPDGTLAVVPESPSSGSGSETSSWLVKDPSSFAAGTDAATSLLVSDPVLRTKQAATGSVEGAIAFRKRREVNGFVETMGNPAVKLGQAVALKGMPEDSLNDLYQVLSLRHVLDRRRGFRTYIGLGGMP